MSEAFLCTLENLLNEFYGSSSSNDRKQQIERELRNLSKDSKAWEYCVQLLQHSNSQYSQWWALSTLEEYVCWKWTAITEDNRSNLRRFMYERCLVVSGIAPSYVVTKCIKVFINIGIRQWHQDSYFFEQIMKLASSTSNVIGTTMLLVLSEELNRPRNDLTASQYMNCKKLLHDKATVILSTVTGLLEGLLSDKEKRHVTPHSSPGSNPSVSPRPGSPLALCTTSPLHSTSGSEGVNNEMVARLLSQTHTRTLVTLDDRAVSTAEAALKCLAHLLSWVPMSELVTPGLISTVFVFAKQGSSELATQAMSCVNEIVSRNRVPNHLEEFIFHLFHQTLQLLAKALEEGPAKLDKAYNKRFVEFLNLFVSGHLRRVESNTSFPIMDFLSLLFKFTFNQTDLDLFYDSLDVCSSWVDFLISLQGYMSPDGTVQRYGCALQQLTELLLWKARFVTNAEELVLVEHDTEGLSEGEHTEWDLFVGKTTQLLSKIIELCPVAISDVLIRMYTEHCECLYQLQQHAVVPANDVSGDVSREKMLQMLRDVGTVTHLTQLVQPSLVGEYFESRNNLTQGILFHTMKSVEVAKRVLGENSTIEPEVQKAFLDIYVNNIYILSMFSQWFVEFGFHSKYDSQYVSMVTTVIDTILPSINNQESFRLQQAILELLHKFVLVLRPHFLIEVSSVQQVYTLALQHTFLYSPAPVISTLNKTLTLGLVLPWQSKSEQDQDWARRGEQFEQFCNSMFADILKIKRDDIDTEVKLGRLREIISRDVTCLCDIVSCIAHRENKSKQVVCRGVKPVVRYVIQLLPCLEKDPHIFESVLHFTTILCDALRVQLGTQFLQELVALCLKIFSFQRSTAHGVGITEKFINLLTTVVKEPSVIYKHFTPDIIDISLNQLWPCVKERPTLCLAYFNLLHGILDFHWSHFYPRSNRNRDICTNESSFMRILQLYGESFVLTDFNVIKQNLLALIDLHDKHELFQKLLYSGRVNLLSEDIEELLFSLTENHGQEFFMRPVLTYLESHLPPDVYGRVSSKLELKNDLTSFRLNLRDVINDAKYFTHQIA